MITVSVDSKTSAFSLGHQGENLARIIYFDLTDMIAEYGEGTATVVHMRASDQVPYICDTTQSGTVLSWAPTSTDTAYAGSGKCELRWVVGDTLAKSIIYTTTIAPSITGAEGVPSPYQSWYDAIIAYIEANYAANGAPQEVREAIYTLLSKAAYTETGLTDELAIVQAWTAETIFVTNNLTHVTNSNTATMAEQGGSYTGTLTANTGYTLGTVTVTMGGEDITATVYSSGTITIPSVSGDIVITATAVPAVASLSAVYTQSGTVYDFDSLDSLKDDLVVTATYSDSTTATVPASDYTLSGTLEAGTSTVTVSFRGATTTFNVTVTQGVPSGYTRLTYVSTNGSQYVDTGVNETQTTHAEYEVMITSQTHVNGLHILSSTNTYFPFLKGGSASDADWKTKCGGKLKGNETFAESGIAVIPFSWEFNRRYIISGYPDTVIDGVTLDSLTAGNTASTSNKLTLFTYGGNATNTAYRFHGSMYWCKIYDSNDDLLRYFIPAKNSSNVAGLYDVINGTFYTSATGTALGAGEVA